MHILNKKKEIFIFYCVSKEAGRKVHCLYMHLARQIYNAPGYPLHIASVVAGCLGSARLLGDRHAPWHRRYAAVNLTKYTSRWRSHRLDATRHCSH